MNSERLESTTEIDTKRLVERCFLPIFSVKRTIGNEIDYFRRLCSFRKITLT